jgi:hypothetical protein
LVVLWRYSLQPDAGLKRVDNAIANGNGIYVKYSARYDPYVGTTALDKLTFAGVLQASFDSGSDTTWATGPWRGATISSSTTMAERRWMRT